MSGIKYLADADSFIYLLDENPIMRPFVSDGPAFSYITEIELISKKGITKTEEIVIKEMLDSCYKVNHSQVLTEMVLN